MIQPENADNSNNLKLVDENSYKPAEDDLRFKAKQQLEHLNKSFDTLIKYNQNQVN
jgi:hypothetical protein